MEQIEVDQNNIIHLKINLGDLAHDKLADLKAFANKVRRMVPAVYNRTGQKVRTIVDITSLKRYDSEGFLILTELMKETEKYTLKTATFGGDEHILAAQDVLLALSGRMNFRAFNTKEEALAWLTAKE